MSADRLPKFLRRRVEDERVEAFVRAIRRSAECSPACDHPGPSTRPLPAVELVDTPRGPVWQLDEATRARLLAPRTDTAELPTIVAVASAPLR